MVSAREADPASIRQQLIRGRRLLTRARIRTAALDAEVLLAHTVNRTREWLWAHDDRRLTPAQVRRYRGLLARRARRVPVAYLRGFKEFFGEAIRVTPAVLIPRPETETLVEAGLRFLAANPAAREVIDLGTGSGAVAVALARHCPRVRVQALDVDRRALPVARANVKNHRLARRVQVRGSDLFAAARPADLVLANLPYLSDASRRRLADDVRYEPARALDGGPDGLRLIRRALAEAPRILRAGGAMEIECDPGQVRSLTKLARSTFPDAQVGMLADLGGRSRGVEVRR